MKCLFLLGIGILIGWHYHEMPPQLDVRFELQRQIEAQWTVIDTLKHDNREIAYQVIDSLIPTAEEIRYRVRAFTPEETSPWGNTRRAFVFDIHDAMFHELHYWHAFADSTLLLLYLANVIEPWEVNFYESVDSVVVVAVCPWDLNKDGIIDISDLSFFAQDYNEKWALSHFSALISVWRAPGWHVYKRRF